MQRDKGVGELGKLVNELITPGTTPDLQHVPKALIWAGSKATFTDADMAKMDLDFFSRLDQVKAAIEQFEILTHYTDLDRRIEGMSNAYARAKAYIKL